MLRQPRTPVVMLFAMVIAIAGLAHAAAPKQAQPQGKRVHAKKSAVTAPQPAPAPVPEPPKVPAQLPPVAPKVTFTNGLLSIDAPNSNLNDVLSAVRRATGASVEGGGADRIVVHLGPGKPRDVLSAMLHGSHYDFIILGPKGDPGGVQRLMLMARAGESPATNAAPPAGESGVAPQQQRPPQAANTNPEEEEEVGDREPEDVSPKGEMPPEQQGEPTPAQPGQPQPGQPPQNQPQPNAPPQAAPGEEQQQQQQQQQGPQVKSPEQLFKELQQLQQQRQQQQQQQQQAPQ